MTVMFLYAKQQKKHTCQEQTIGLGEGEGGTI